MKSSGEIRRMARNVLANNWGGAVAVTLIVSAISGAVGFFTSFLQSIFSVIDAGTHAIISEYAYYGSTYNSYSSYSAMPEAGTIAAIGITGAITAIILSLLSTFVVANLQVGQVRYFVNLASGRKAEISTVFSQFGNGIFKAFGLSLYIGLKTALWFLIGYIPGVVLLVAGNLMVQSTVILSAVLVVIGICAVLAGIVLSVIATYRYIMAYYVLADNPNMGIRASVKCSKQLMHGHKAEFFILELSFIGWAFLCLFTCGIGYLFLNPYMSTAYAVFYCELTGKPVIDHSLNPYGYDPNFAAHNGYNRNGYNQNGYNPNVNNQNAYNQNGYNPNVNNQNGYNQSGYNQSSATASGTASPMPESGAAAATQSTPETPPMANMPESTPGTSSDAVPDMQADVPKIEQIDISAIGGDAPSIEEIGKNPENSDGNSDTQK